jgi:hypothetical protein
MDEYLLPAAGCLRHGRQFGCANSPCGRPGGYGGWWFWPHRHQQLVSYLGRIRSELA